MTNYDVIVIGAGPAGETAAAILADRDINTLLIEKEKLPRQKICGGAVSKRALSLLEAADVIIPKLKTFKKCQSMQLGTFDFESIEDLATIKFENEAAYLTDRAKFDYALVQNAISKGAELKQKLNPKRFIKLLANDNAIATDYVKIVLGDSTYRQFLKNTFKKMVV